MSDEIQQPLTADETAVAEAPSTEESRTDVPSKRVPSLGERVDRALQLEKAKNAKLLEEIKTLKIQLASAKRGSSRIPSIPGGKKAKKAEVEPEESDS